MNINRLRPDGVKPENLDLWLSGVIWDAIRDARKAGLDVRFIAHLLVSILASVGGDAWGWNAACIKKFTEHFRRGLM